MGVPLAAQTGFERISEAPEHEFYIFTGPLVSNSGRFVAFDAIPLDAGGQLLDGPNLWLKDRTTSAIQAVGSGSLGGLSADGEFVAFTDPAHKRVFVYERTNQTTAEIQVPVQQDDAFVPRVVISGDGRYVAFSATGSGEGALDYGVFLHDRALGRTEVLLDAAPIPSGARGLGFVSDINHDGRFIVFTSHRDLVTPDAAEDSSGGGADSDVFVVERGTQRIERISVPTTGPEAAGSSWVGSISGDGRYVAFMSEAANLVDGDPTPGYGSIDVFLRDRVARVTTRVSPDRSAEEPNSQSAGVDISADGSTVVYQSQAIVNEGPADLFFYDVAAGRITERIRIDPDSHENDHLGAVLTGDGRYVAFRTDAALNAADIDAADDVYIDDRGPRSRVLLRIETPNRLSRWGIGTRQRLAWRYEGNAPGFVIDVSRDGGTTWTWIATEPNKPGTSQSFYWVVTGPVASAVRLRVQAIESPDATDVNDADIRIAEPFIRVILPYSRTLVGVGTAAILFFEHNLGANRLVAIDVSGDDGASWRTIADGVLTRGSTTSSYHWVVDVPPTARARVRIRALDGTVAVGHSEAFAVIHGPGELTVTDWPRPAMALANAR
jgi:Tol biopolymer transport system component